jgi:hypothetical protein
MYKPANKRNNEMQSYYDALMTKHSAIIVERYWEMEHYNATDIVYESRADFNDYLHKNVFSSLLSFKFKTAKEINEFVDKMWEEEKGNIVEEVDLDAKPFWTDDNWDDEYHIKRILKSHQRYEETEFTKALEESIKGKKITNKKAHYLTQLKAHPLYDLIVFMCMGNLKAMHYEISQYWEGN